MLLQAHEQPGPFFEAPPSELAFAALQAAQIEAVGDEIGPYMLLEQIGEGGFGEVYFGVMAVQRLQREAEMLLGKQPVGQAPPGLRKWPNRARPRQRPVVGMCSGSKPRQGRR